MGIYTVDRLIERVRRNMLAFSLLWDLGQAHPPIGSAISRADNGDNFYIESAFTAHGMLERPLG